MADEVQGKKPKPIGTPAPNVPKPKQEPASAPKQQLAPKQNAKPLSGAKIQPGSPYKSESTPVGVQQKKFESPKHVDKRVNKMFSETKQPTLGVWNKNNTHPMAKPDQVKMNPNLNYKPTEEQLQAANRKRIMQAGFAPKNWDGKSDIQEPVSSPAPAKNPTPNPFKGNTMPGFEGMDELWDNMMNSGQKVIDNDKEERTKSSELFGTDLNKSQEPQWDKDNEPGSGVVTKELTDWVRNYLTEQVGEDYANTVVANLHKNANQADFYKQKMKEAYEREQASEMFGTDLKKKYPWLPDENYQEPEGFKSEEWFDTDLKQKSDEDLIKMHDNLAKKLWNLRYRSPEEEALQSEIEKEYLKRHPSNLEDE